MFTRLLLLELEPAHKSLGLLLQCRFWFFWYRWNQRLCVSRKLPEEAGTMSLMPVLRAARLWVHRLAKPLAGLAHFKPPWGSPWLQLMPLTLTQPWPVASWAIWFSWASLGPLVVFWFLGMTLSICLSNLSGNLSPSGPGLSECGPTAVRLRTVMMAA